MDSATLAPVLADLINGPGFLGILIVIGLFLGSAVLGLFFFFYIVIKELASSKKPPEPPKPPKLSEPPELPDRREDGLGIQPASIIHRAKKTISQREL